MISNLLKRFRAWRCSTGRHSFDETPVLCVDRYSELLQLKCECRHCPAIIFRPYDER